MKEAKRIAEQNKVEVALTFSDPSMVKYFSKQMEEIVGASVDLLFCNDEEALIFTGTSSIGEAREELKEVAKRFVITLGANGALIFDGDTFINIEPYKSKPSTPMAREICFLGLFCMGSPINIALQKPENSLPWRLQRLLLNLVPGLKPLRSKGY